MLYDHLDSQRASHFQDPINAKQTPQEDISLPFLRTHRNITLNGTGLVSVAARDTGHGFRLNTARSSNHDADTLTSLNRSCKSYCKEHEAPDDEWAFALQRKHFEDNGHSF